ncbi:hypothetical protein LCGC14_2468700, partial [marine sediment metagenome]
MSQKKPVIKPMIKINAPYDGQFIKELQTTSWEEADVVLDEMSALFKDRSTWPPMIERIAILEKFGKLLAERADELALQSAQEGGKPLNDSIIEINRAVNGVSIAIRELAQLKGT